MHHFIRKKLFSSASARRRKKEHDCYLKNGSAVLEEILALCDGNCRIPIRYFSATEIEMAIKHSENKLELSDGYMVTGSLDKRLVLVRFKTCHFDIIHRPVLVRLDRYQFNIHRDIAITAQMSHLKNVLRLVGCCLEFEKPVMVYEYVEAITLDVLLFNKGNISDHARKSLFSWGSRLQIANEVASGIVFLHTEFNTPIIHKDMKPSNVIIDQNSGIAKLVDFSLSISLPPGELKIVTDIINGKLEYLAPEYAFHGFITQKIDVYSFGVLLLVLLTGKEVHYFMESNVEEGNIADRVDSTISEEPLIDFEEDAKSNIEEVNVMDRVDSAISEETIDIENHQLDAVHLFIKKSNVMDIADPAILDEHGIEIQQQLEDYLDLVKKCTAYKGEDRPYMIHVARELCRIHKCFRDLTLG